MLATESAIYYTRVHSMEPTKNLYLYSKNRNNSPYCSRSGLPQRAAPGPHAAPWPILCGPRALLEKLRKLQKLLLLFADSTLLH